MGGSEVSESFRRVPTCWVWWFLLYPLCPEEVIISGVLKGPIILGGVAINSFYRIFHLGLLTFHCAGSLLIFTLLSHTAWLRNVVLLGSAHILVYLDGKNVIFLTSGSFFRRLSGKS